MNDFELVIFDMDGLMFDTETVSFLSFTKAVKSYGHELDEATFRKTIAANIKKVREIYLERFGNGFPFDDMLERKFAYAAEYIQQNGVPVKPGLYELLDFLCLRKIKKAVATSSNRAVAMNLLTMAKVAEQFDYILCGDEIEKSKPDPDIFLRAADKLQRRTDQCLVLEDAAMGVLAAHRAGMKTVMIPDLVAPDEETLKIADYVMDSLYDVKAFLETK